MGDPLTASAAVGLGSSLLGGVVKGIGEQNAIAAKKQADLQNQQLAKLQAGNALQRGAWQTGQLRMRASQTIGTQRAAFGASGVDVNSGSPAALQAATRAVSEQDVTMAQHNAMQEAWGHEVMANQYGAQAAADESESGQAEVGSILGGVGEAASGFGHIARAGSLFAPDVSDSQSAGDAAFDE
ncbi:MAG: hypothetical protein JST54_12515 [Deltaproteobacteria bacterium]|nr:hypothetical protein [Deltaproteobacteria bacterium]